VVLQEKKHSEIDLFIFVDTSLTNN